MSLHSPGWLWRVAGASAWTFVLLLPAWGDLLLAGGISALCLWACATLVLAWFAWPALPAVLFEWLAAVALAWGLEGLAPQAFHTGFVLEAGFLFALIAMFPRLRARFGLWLAAAALALTASGLALGPSPWSLLLPHTPNLSTGALIAALALSTRATAPDAPRAARLRWWALLALPAAIFSLSFGQSYESYTRTAQTLTQASPLFTLFVMGGVFHHWTRSARPDLSLVLRRTGLVFVATLGGPLVWAWSLQVLVPVVLAVQVWSSWSKPWRLAWAAWTAILVVFTHPPGPVSLSEGLSFALSGITVFWLLRGRAILGDRRPA